MGEATRVAILPRAVSSRVITTAVSLASCGAGMIILLLAAVVLIDVLVGQGLGEHLPAPLGALLIMIGALLVSALWPNTWTRLLYVVVGGVCAVAYQVALLGIHEEIGGAAEFLITRPGIALVFAGVSVVRPLAGLGWSLFGYAVATIVDVVSSLLVAMPVQPGWAPTTAFVINAGAYIVLAVIYTRQDRRIPDLARLEDDTRRLAIENQFEQRAAAMVHDTVLSDLTSVMNSAGILDDRARDRFRADVATLSDAAWLRESAAVGLVKPLDAALRNALEGVVSDFQWRGLSVDVTGDSDLAVAIAPNAAADLVLAVRACLDNVLDHAGAESAELVITTTEDAVTVMVIDGGSGFDPDRVGADRLGIRSAVVNRITTHGGSVRVWSTPGQGTSVLISVPGEKPEGDA